MPDLQFLEPASFGPSTLPFSQGVRAGNLLFIAGQGAVDDEGNLVGQGDIREQTRVRSIACAACARRPAATSPTSSPRPSS